MNKRAARAHVAEDGERAAIPGNLLPPLRYFGSEFVLNAETGMFYRVTPTAMVLLQAMAENTDNESLVRTIQTHSGVDRITAVRDIELLINELSVRGILTTGTAKQRP